MEQFSLDVALVTLGGRPKSTVNQRRANRFKPDVWRDIGLFYRLNPATRFSINVLVEAILSTWAASPLPGDPGTHRYTQNLVRAIGWEAGFPGSTIDRSPINSLIKRVHADLHMKEREALHRAKQGNSRADDPYPESATAPVDHQEEASQDAHGKDDPVLSTIALYRFADEPSARRFAEKGATRNVHS